MEQYSIDLQDIINKDYYSLWERYAPLQMKFFKKVPENIRHDLYEDFQEFRDDCYIILVNAADAVKPEKIKNPDTYSFYIQYSQYLTNFTTRDITRDYINNQTIKYMDYGVDNEEHNWEWGDSFTEEDIHSNIEELLPLLSEKGQSQAFKIMYHIPHGGKGLKKKDREIFEKYYTKY